MDALLGPRDDGCRNSIVREVGAEAYEVCGVTVHGASGEELLRGQPCICHPLENGQRERVGGEMRGKWGRDARARTRCVLVESIDG